MSEGPNSPASYSQENAPPEPPVAQPVPSQLHRDLRGWTRDLAVVLGFLLVIIIFLYQPVKVEGTSMAPLLSDQERIFINKFAYHFEPINRGDVVVFWYPLDRSKSFIKRVIAIPGDTVEIKSGHLYLNGEEVREPYVPKSYLDENSYAARRLEPDEYFVMGDHRDSSNDSRMFGPVSRDYIYGKAVFAYWPADHFGSLTSPSTVSAASK